MLERHFTAKRINEIVNHPSIYPSICGSCTAPFDLTPITTNPNHVCLVGEHGCFLLIKHQTGIYELHSSVLPEGRGEWTIAAGREVQFFMFTNTDAFEIMTKCPHGNLAAKAGARMSGAELMFATRPIWPIDGKLVPVDVYSVILQKWVKNTDNLVESGKWFHKCLELEYNRLDIKLSVHAEDEVHDRYVGAAIEMIRGGQVGKAINFYNRFASMADYKKIGLISVEPLIIDIDECRLNIKKDSFEVLLCQPEVLT